MKARLEQTHAALTAEQVAISAIVAAMQPLEDALAADGTLAVQAAWTGLVAQLRTRLRAVLRYGIPEAMPSGGVELTRAHVGEQLIQAIGVETILNGQARRITHGPRSRLHRAAAGRCRRRRARARAPRRRPLRRLCRGRQDAPRQRLRRRSRCSQAHAEGLARAERPRPPHRRRPIPWRSRPGCSRWRACGRPLQAWDLVATYHEWLRDAAAGLGRRCSCRLRRRRRGSAAPSRPDQGRRCRLDHGARRARELRRARDAGCSWTSGPSSCRPPTRRPASPCTSTGPNAVAPQALLLAVAPTQTGHVGVERPRRDPRRHAGRGRGSAPSSPTTSATRISRCCRRSSRRSTNDVRAGHGEARRDRRRHRQGAEEPTCQLFDIKAAQQLMHLTLQFPPVIVGWNRLEGRPAHRRFRAARSAPRCATRCGSSRASGSSASSKARTPARPWMSARRCASIRCSTTLSIAPRPLPTIRRRPLETHVERETVPFDLTLHAQVTRIFWRADRRRAEPAPCVRAKLPRCLQADGGAIAGRLGDDDATRHAFDAGGARIARCLEAAEGRSPTAARDRRERLRPAGRARPRRSSRPGTTSPPGSRRSSASRRRRRRRLAWRRSSNTSSPSPPTPPIAGRASSPPSSTPRVDLDWFAFDVDATPGAHVTRGDGSTAVPTPASGEPLSFIPTPVSFRRHAEPPLLGDGEPADRVRRHRRQHHRHRQAAADRVRAGLRQRLVRHPLRAAGRHAERSRRACSSATPSASRRSLAAGRARAATIDWQRWSMFTLSAHAGDGRGRHALLPAARASPSCSRRRRSRRSSSCATRWPTWRGASSASSPSRLGQGISGYTVAARAAATVPAPPPLHATTAPVRYVLGTDVPYNWIPFIPVHRPGSRARCSCSARACPRTRAGRRGRRAPRSSSPKPYFINEEEVPRAGKLVTRGYQRARWLDGRDPAWIGRRVTTGRGEGSSGLAFDQAVDVPRSGT